LEPPTDDRTAMSTVAVIEGVTAGRIDEDDLITWTAAP
jgi:hypothetical protein